MQCVFAFNYFVIIAFISLFVLIKWLFTVHVDVVTTVTCRTRKSEVIDDIRETSAWIRHS